MLITPATPDLAFPAPERVFLGWDRALLHRAARLLAERHRQGSELRLDAATVVLPGGRAARRLKRLLAEVAQAEGARLFPPRVITVGSLPEVLYEAPHPPCTAATATQAWAAALRGTPEPELARLLAAPPAPSDLRGWTRAAARVMALHAELCGAGLHFAEVAERCGAGLLHDDSARWHALAGVQQRYRATLAALGLADRDLSRIDALREGGVRAAGTLWLVGVAEMPGIARSLVARATALGAPVTALVQAPAEEAAGFDALGCLLPDAWVTRPIPLRDDQVAVRDRPTDQADEVVRTLAALDGRFAAEEIVIAVPDPSLVPLLEERIGRAGAAARPATGRPLGRAPLVRLLAAVAEQLADDSWESCAALLRHPDLLDRLARDAAPGDHPERWLEELDRHFADHLPSRFATGGTLESSPLLRELCERLHAPALLGGLGGTRPLSEWPEILLALVGEVYGHRELSRDRPADREVMESCDRLREAAAELRALPASLAAPCDAPTAIRLLLDALAGGHLRPPVREGAIELLGWLELRLDDAPVAVVTAFNEPFLPECVNGDPYLPNALRERLGLVCNAWRLARDAYELAALLHSREHLHLVAGRRSADGDPLSPSRLFLATEGPALAERVQRFHRHPEPATRPLAPDDPATDGFRMPRLTTLTAPAPLRSLRVTDFRRLLDDPYLWALERVLGLQSAGDADREMDGLAFGSLAHDVLREFGRSALVNGTDEAAARARLDALLDEAADLRFGGEPLPAPRVQVEQLRARLHRFARWHCAWIADGWRVVAVECGTPPDGAPIEVDGQRFGVRGRIDRIDHHPATGRWALLDYKTGDRAEDPEKAHRVGKEKRWKDLQLPLYRTLLPHLVHPDGTALAGPGAGDPLLLGYLCLPSTLDEVGERLADWNDEELAGADVCAMELLRLLARNQFTHDPTRTRGQAGSPFGVLLGVGFLESGMMETDESAEVVG